MAKIKIDDKLKEHSLDIYPINALKNEASSYTIGIIQPLEDITANDNEVKNVNTTSIKSKYKQFFQKVNSDRRELVLSPEYSCPWDTLLAQFDSNFPITGCIWVLGCESITIEKLNEIKTNNSDILFIHEDFSNLDSLGDRNFLDPIVYCFNAKDENDTIKKIVVVQFKRRPMVDHLEEKEKDHLILGNDYYEIQNDENSVGLITLICAEAIDFDLDLDINRAYLIPHLQLNTQPFHPSFMQYRLNTFKERSNVEFICVNWARGFRMDGSAKSKYGGSAYYLHSDKIKYDDARMNDNHQKGIYYSYSTVQHYHRYTLNYNEHVFYLKSNQILQSGTSNINQRRHGIEATKTFVWEDAKWDECALCNDRWQEELNAQGYFDRVSFLSTYSAMTKERFLNITSGFNLSKIKWYDFTKLHSFHLDSDERPKKLSVFFDPRNTQDLNTITNKVSWLQRKVLSAGLAYPAKFSSLEGITEFKINEDPKDCHINIDNGAGRSSATFVGIGNDSFINAKRIYENIADAIKEDQRKLIVWYEDDYGRIQNYVDVEEPKIDNDYSESRKSITKDIIEN